KGAMEKRTLSNLMII
ncbi:Protease 4, partial [Haemophilus influenzae]